MGKRTSYKRKKQDFYPTPLAAAEPLFSFLRPGTRFDEPCSGDGALVEHLKDAGFNCVNSSDLIRGQDAMDITGTPADYFITNPPWTWSALDLMITHLSDMKPTWLLLNGDLMHNIRMGPHMKRCEMVASVGRISWHQNGKAGFENCAWYLFRPGCGQTKFFGRG